MEHTCFTLDGLSIQRPRHDVKAMPPPMDQAGSNLQGLAAKHRKSSRPPFSTAYIV